MEILKVFTRNKEQRKKALGQVAAWNRYLQELTEDYQKKRLWGVNFSRERQIRGRTAIRKVFRIRSGEVKKEIQLWSLEAKK
ncbi:MAG: hypothetical protein UX87_C0006G0006 [Candidatus Amesbacteria bacterium GW2011_GWA1_47_16]|uniref:Uncharacterized protein n=5 Tax=Candidatus Amesiibacteriota TaxID=1752730 RepID=A0A1F4ZX57_9BACT|nr:MAG: hypothetical protein UX86_C0015G0052 [Candidatus Amesbacteria bacterium GW2011_GWC1_47_15]KKU64606.1 MAG: hypothetical protein UX87_C0006G0006 [Candidatus Amesbacteria bacterium GW2011_GWA1_47_16]KKU97870.1 MAG: hypothetical protein UY28_C0012G0034 [Candidatus Amesbacteria bacterium GW2011_GWB1_48_13]OGD00098.1 MAG: hypothetical protein A2972_01120 [Candidatus Amesbacteria bacterium RIFCSPLOWO2_01_FULL_47_33]OGD00813.1 MAG: hypothetical protein A2701_03865 [Candidatus Amesbacteria bacte